MELGRSGWKRLTAESSEAVSRSAPEQPPTPAREHELTTVIDAGCEIDGALVLQKSIRIEGEFRGSLESSGTVT
ncbi:MAG: hypothetical protein OEM49_10255, partial [Myxococcales bacterium]|nr:hypothetical protein [Myxococcales bacterium]